MLVATQRVEITVDLVVRSVRFDVDQATVGPGGSLTVDQVEAALIRMDGEDPTPGDRTHYREYAAKLHTELVRQVTPWVR